MAYDKDDLRPNDIIRTSINIDEINAEGKTVTRTETFSDFNANNNIDHGFWINDLYFEVPPERITSQEENNFMEFQGLRKVGSHKIPVNVSSEIFGISFTVPHKDAIVNMDIRDGSPKKGGEGNTGKRGGLLDLIIQFKNVPFASIENAYLRSKLKIPDTHNMVFCLHNISISTSPGEPNTINVSMTISLMAYTAYSDKWLYKQFWISQKGYSFEDVNPIRLEGKVNYVPPFKERMAEQQEILDKNLGLYIPPANYKWPNIITPALAEAATPVSNKMNVIDPQYAEVDSMNSIDVSHMIPFNVTRRAAESEPYKAYIDWLYAKHSKIVINNNGEIGDAAKIQPYGAGDHNLGEKISFTYKEFRTIPLDPRITDRLRLYFKRRIAQFRADLFRDIMTSADGYEQTIMPTLPPEYYAETDERKKAYMLFESVKQSEVFADYRIFVDEAKKGGWELYQDDPTSYDLFYRVNTINMKCSNSSVNLSDLKEETRQGNSEESFLICDFISGSMHNIYQKIPIQGIIHPTAQYLGASDSNFLLAVKGLGLNSVKVFDLIKDTIKKQSLLYKYIPEASVVKVENPLINATGDFYFVINGLESATVPEQPGLYSMEMRLTGNNIVIKDTKIKRESMQSSPAIKEIWLNELFENSPLRGAQAPYIKFTDRVGFSVMQPDGRDFPYLQELAATMNLANSLMFIPGDANNAPYSDSFNKEQKAKVLENWKNHKPLGIFFKYWGDNFKGFVAETRSYKGKITEYGIPLYFLIRPYEDNRDLTFKNPPASSEYFNFLVNEQARKSGIAKAEADEGLLKWLLGRSETDPLTNSSAMISPNIESAAPPLWDFALEKFYPPVERLEKYTLENEVARAASFTRSDLVDAEPYTRAYQRWQVNKREAAVYLQQEYINRNKLKSINPKKEVIVGYFPPYLAAHRDIMALAANTFIRDVKLRILEKFELAKNPRNIATYNGISELFNGSNNIAFTGATKFEGLFVDDLNVNDPKVLEDLNKGKHKSEMIQGLSDRYSRLGTKMRALFLTAIADINGNSDLAFPFMGNEFANYVYKDFYFYDGCSNLNFFGQETPISWYRWTKINSLNGYTGRSLARRIASKATRRIVNSATKGGIDIAWQTAYYTQNPRTNKEDEYVAKNGKLTWTSLSSIIENNKNLSIDEIANIFDKSLPPAGSALGWNNFIYILCYLVVPYLINVLRFDEIYKISTMTPYFPKTREFIVSTQQNLIGASYEDLNLPNHPFWNEPTRIRNGNPGQENETLIIHGNVGRGSSFTEPDFYLANPGIDYPDYLCIEAQRVLEVPDQKVVNLTPSDAYNVYTQMAGETAMGDLKLFLTIPDMLRTDNKANSKENARTPGASTGDAGAVEGNGGGQSQALTSELWYKHIPATSYAADNTSARLNFDPNNDNAVKWGNVALKDFNAYFGDNLELMDPMVQNFGADSTLTTSGLTNWTYQEYDLMTHEEHRLRLRDSYVIEDFRVGEKELTPKGTPVAQPPIKNTGSEKLNNLIQPYAYLGGSTPLFKIFKDVAEKFAPYLPTSKSTGVKLTTEQLYMFMLMIDFNESGFNPKAQVKSNNKALNIVSVKGIPDSKTVVRPPLPGTVKGSASAYGIGAFLDSSWVGVQNSFVEKYGGNDGILYTDEELITRRQDPVAQVQALAVNIMNAYGQATDPQFQYGSRDPNTNKLSIDNGVNDIFTNVYIQHFLGGAGARALMAELQTDPTVSVGEAGKKPPLVLPLNNVNASSGKVEIQQGGALFDQQTIEINRGPLGPPDGSRLLIEVYLHIKGQGITAQEWLNKANLAPNAKGQLPEIPQDRALAAYPFNDMQEDGTGDSSPYMNFSNTRYPTFSKMKDALKSLGRRKLAARRAFPVCKIYFFEEDDIYNKQYIELDEMYTYSSIESIEISESRKRPASICRITFIDPHGILSGMNQWNKALNPSFTQGGSVYGEALGNNYGADTEVTGNASFIKDTKYEQSDLNFILNTGLKIKVKMGFSNDANKLEEVFLGEVKEVNMDQSSARIDMVAMGYGAELVAKVHGTTEDGTEKVFSTTFELLSYLMFSEEIVHFGRRKFDSVDLMMSDRSIGENQRNYKETFGNSALYNSFRQPNPYFNAYNIPIAGDVGRAGTAIVDEAVNLIYRQSYNAAKQLRMEPIGGPQDDNIFAPNFNTLQATATYSWFDKWTGRLSQNSELKKVDYFNTTLQRPENGVIPPGGFKTQEDFTKAIEKLVKDAEDLINNSKATPEQKVKAKADLAILKSESPLADKINATRNLGVGLGAIVVAAIPFGFVCIIFALLIFVGAIFATLLSENAEEAWRIEILERLGYLDYTWVEAIDPESVKYNIYYSTAWDMFEEMTYRHPGYIKHPKIYEGSNRMTMFFGLPDQNMWTGMTDPIDVYRANLVMKEIHEEVSKQTGTEQYASGALLDRFRREKMGTQNSPALDIQSAQIQQIKGGIAPGQDILVSADKISRFMKIARRRFKPFRRWHNLNSYTDIISNDLEATAEGWYTEVSISYSTAADIVDAADDAEGNDTQSGAKSSNAFIDWDPEKSITVKASSNLIPSNIRSTSFQWPNAKSSTIAKRYARSILAKQAKEMYKGSILVLGSPHIRPYDVIILNDTYNDMYGPIEVEEVHHMFTPDTGFVTQIYPDTFIIQEDLTPYVIFNGVNWEVYQKTEVYIKNALQAFPLYGSKEDLSTNTLAFLTRYKQIFDAYKYEAEATSKAVRDASSFISLDDMRKNPLFSGLATATAIGAGLTAGLTANNFGGPIAGVAAGIFGAFTANSFFYFYASAQITQSIVSYMTDSKAFFMMPLVRAGVPMLSGFNMGYGNSFYKGPLDYVRQYWADGARGINQKQADLQMQYAKLAERNGGAITNQLANSYLWGTQNVGMDYDRLLLEGGDLAANTIKGLTAGNLSFGMFTTETVDKNVVWKLKTGALAAASNQKKP
jgi:hypothetical protein